MEKKTHVMCANLVSICLMKPDNISDLLITCGCATLGGLVPDVDLKDSTSDKLFDRLMTSLITIVLLPHNLEQDSGTQWRDWTIYHRGPQGAWREWQVVYR